MHLCNSHGCTDPITFSTPLPRSFELYICLVKRGGGSDEDKEDNYMDTENFFIIPMHALSDVAIYNLEVIGNVLEAQVGITAYVEVPM